MVRIPPALLVLVFASLSWGLSQLLTGLSYEATGFSRIGAFLGFGIGGLLLTSGVAAFIRARTTVNPLKPETAGALVTTGLYRFTRNPMYLGMFLVLIGWACTLSNYAAFAAPFLFCWAITELQIKPEEAVLRNIFGDAYQDYCKRTRRWI